MPEHLVAVDDLPVGIDRDQPVGVAVEREAGVGAGGDDRARPARPGRSRPSATLMLLPSGLGVDDLDPGAGRGRGCSGADDRSRAVRAVEHEVQPAGVDRRGQAEPVAPVVVEPRRRVDHPAELGVRRRRAAPRSAR